MRLGFVLIAIISLVWLSGCSGEGGMDQREAMPSSSGPAAQPQAAPDVEQAKKASVETRKSAFDGSSDVNMNQPVVEMTSRKIIRNDELSVETDTPADVQRKITAIAESHGGFVVTSEYKQQDNRNLSRTGETVTIVARVPSLQFESAIEQIRATGSRVLQEKVTGQDVTEEYIDLEARISTKKALEAQFLEIMKQARKVSEALEVQSQIADVRTEIERLEGRKRFLENQSALSTITVTLTTPAPTVTATTSGFGDDVKKAFGDGVDFAAALILGLIRLIIVLIPLAVFVFLPLALLIRVAVRRFRVTRKQEPVTDIR